MNNNKDVIIIGAGYGGLSCATFLTRNGYNVKIFERKDRPGGYVHTFQMGQYRGELSTYQTYGVKGMYKPTYEALGLSDIPVISMENSYEAIYFNNDEIVDRYVIKAGKEKSIESFAKYFPAEKETIENLFGIVEKVSADFERVLHLKLSNPVDNLYDFVTFLCLQEGKSNSMIQQLGLFSYQNMMEYLGTTVEEFMSKLSENKDFLFLISQYNYFTAGSPDKVSFLAMIILCFRNFLMDHPNFIRGGSQNIVDKLVSQIKAKNGEIILNSEVRRVLTENGKTIGVRLANGETHFADYVVADVSAEVLFNRMVDNRQLINSETRNELWNYKHSKSAFQINLGLPFLLSDYGFDVVTNFFSGSKDLLEILGDGKCKMDDFSQWILLDATGLGDKGYYAPEGKSSVTLVKLDGDIEEWSNYDKVTHEQKKQEIKEQFIATVQKVTGLPLDKAEESRTFSPSDWARISGNPDGGVIGAYANPCQVAGNRFSYKTCIEGLILVGADSPSAGGTSSCLDSGLWGATTIMSESTMTIEKMSALLKQKLGGS